MLHIRRLVILVLLVLALSACDSAESSALVRSGSGYEVDALFSDFFVQLGGGRVLGEPISPLFTYGPISYQYTVNALLAYDPDAPDAERYYLAALGLDTGFREPAVAAPDDPALRYLNGHIIDPAFEPLYQAIGGRRIAGDPMTEARYNPERNRIEQHFANVGMYRLKDDPPDVARLIAYGLWKCDASCRQPSGVRSDMRLILPYAIDPAFAPAVERLGAHFTGLPVGEAYINEDGQLEQVFENLALVRGSGKKGRIFTLPLLERLKVSAQPPRPPAGQPGMAFIAIQDGLGFDVPQRFLDALALHGGLDISGLPITPLEQPDETSYRQCFTNLCLVEYLDENGPLRIRPEPLGYDYWQQIGGQGGQPQPTAAPEEKHKQEGDAPDQPAEQPAQPEGGNSESKIIIQIWEQYPVLAPDQRQEIGVIILENNTPVRSLEPDLDIFLPGGDSRHYYMFPTNRGGKSILSLDPLQLSPGETVAYRVCIHYPLGEKNCAEDSFLIWEP
jgi:hypothetical protein